MKTVLSLSISFVVFFFFNFAAAYAQTNESPPNEDGVSYTIENGMLQLMLQEKRENGEEIQIRTIRQSDDGILVYYRLLQTQSNEHHVTYTTDTYPKALKHLPKDVAEPESITLVNEEVAFEQLTKNNIVQPDKSWSVSFSSPIANHSITDNNLYLLDSNGKKMDPFIIHDGSQTITILPPKGNYTPGETYSIYLTEGIVSTENVHLKKGYQLTFTIEDTDKNIQKSMNEEPIEIDVSTVPLSEIKGWNIDFSDWSASEIRDIEDTQINEDVTRRSLPLTPNRQTVPWKIVDTDYHPLERINPNRNEENPLFKKIKSFWLF
ncbi:Ig-like domain-containing protein [Alkalihalobacillus sp. LMS39]|uniref:Ig-like domain-containing protein n=1 Tax=Alkalihalobacillus sp. LMS39 TaxID=2924032 RepID=UPI001FB47119|nr:Ig-like domain-containing protein [Alkalihalobacillus sp. LMS39]UOE95358.1 Ig-like domain-containing protein [Alkalihalobacillus sp. LMS39]